MMLRSDRLFAEAARSPESCDKLLRQHTRGRLITFIIFIVFGVLAIAGVCYEMSQLGHFMDAIVNLKFGDKSPDGPKLSQFAGLTFAAVIMFILELIFLFYADACVKMLLILQQQQSVARAKESIQKAVS